VQGSGCRVIRNLFQHFLGDTEGNQEKPEAGWPNSWPIFESTASEMRSRSATPFDVGIKNTVFWNVTPCSLVEVYRRSSVMSVVLLPDCTPLRSGRHVSYNRHNRPPKERRNSDFGHHFFIDEIVVG
jgi:hypothetical protein